MKKYRLKQWYPSLPPGLKTGMIVEFNGINSIRWEIRNEHEFTDYNYEFNGLELKCAQFWELIEEKEPLFVTEDGVKVFDKDTVVYNVKNDTFVKIGVYAAYLNKHDFEHKVFFHESNADKYIWQNKRVFSYEDFMKWGNVPCQRAIEQLAKKRSKG